jgi:nucleotide-binding universal stress UspA family protein
MTVAVAVDGSPASRNALDHAVRLARGRNCALAGVFVLDSGWADFIGNDWQSSRDARQSFLDYVLDQQRQQAEEARRQFAAATAGWPDACFAVVAGDPCEALCELMARGDADTLVAGREVFQVCGRPSLKSLARNLTRRIAQPVIIV